MSDLLRTIVQQNAGTTWRVSTSYSATSCHVRVDLGDGVVFRARGTSVEEAETRAAAKIVEWADLRQPEPGNDDGLVEQLEASIAVERAKRGRPALRVIKGGKS